MKQNYLRLLQPFHKIQEVLEEISHSSLHDASAQVGLRLVFTSALA